MSCISKFLEQMDHEFPDYSNNPALRDGYKVDGNGIKLYCDLNKLKSVDYFEDHDERGFLYVEFSDLLKQDSNLQAQANRIKESNLEKKDKTRLRKAHFKQISKELVSKLKDSVTIRHLMRNKIQNIPQTFDELGIYTIVVPPLSPQLDRDKAIERLRFLDTLKDKVAQGIPEQMYSDVRILTLDKF